MQLVDTHCHINMMVKKEFDRPLTQQEVELAGEIVEAALTEHVSTVLNVGTSLVESKNCIALAMRYEHCFASVGIHPNDATDKWQDDIKVVKKMLSQKEHHKIVAVGECGIDKYHPDYNLQRQKDVFAAQIELALEHNLGLIVHTRDAGDETLRCLDEYSKESLRGTIHCFSDDLSFAQQAISLGFVLGLGGTITYPKNASLRAIAQSIPLEHLILETDAPFLPPQPMRGKQNHPQYIKYIATYLADLRGISVEELAKQTTSNAMRVFPGLVQE